MAALFKTPLASAEYEARFNRPHINVIGRDLSRVLQTVLDVLSPFNLTLADCEITTSGRLVDHKIAFKLLERNITFHVSAEGWQFTKEGASWSTAEEDLKVLETVENVVLEITEATIVSRSTSLNMHLQLLSVPREEVLSPLVPLPFKHLLEQGILRTFGNQLRWNGGSVLLDFSVPIANGIFARLSSESDAPTPREAFEKARENQLELYRVLQVEEDVNAAA